MKIEFSYFQGKDGRYYICDVHPDHMIKKEEIGVWVPDNTRYQIEVAYCMKKADEDVYTHDVNPNQVPDFRIKSRSECNALFTWRQLLDLSNIPKPKWEDKSPILVILDVTPKTTYYELD